MSPDLTLLTVSVLWGINPAVMKVGLVWLSPLLYNFLRVLIAACFAIAALALSGQHKPVLRQDWALLLKLSMGGFFLFQVFFTLGVQKTTAGNTSLILATLPVWVAVLSQVFKLAITTKRAWTGIGLSLLGVALIVVGSGKEISLASDHLAGAALLCLAQLGNAYYTIYAKEALERYSHYQITAILMVSNAIAFAILEGPSIGSVNWEGVGLSGWLSAAYSGFFALWLGNILWVTAVSKAGAARAAMFANLLPVFSIVAGNVLLDETFGLLQGVGALVIFAGLYLTRKDKEVNQPAR